MLRRGHYFDRQIISADRQTEDFSPRDLFPRGFIPEGIYSRGDLFNRQTDWIAEGIISTDRFQQCLVDYVVHLVVYVYNVLYVFCLFCLGSRENMSMFEISQNKQTRNKTLYLYGVGRWRRLSTLK